MLLQNDLAQDGWDYLLPEVMDAFRATPHSRADETPNYLMLRRECTLSDQLIDRTHSVQPTSSPSYALALKENLDSAFGLLGNCEMLPRQLDEYADGHLSSRS